MLGNVYFHIGFPKTATTFLQKAIYPFLKRIHYIPVLTQKRYQKEILKILSEDLSDNESQSLRKMLLRNKSKREF